MRQAKSGGLRKSSEYWSSQAPRMEEMVLWGREQRRELGGVMRNTWDSTCLRESMKSNHPQHGQTYFFSSILSSTTCLAWSPFVCTCSLPYLRGLEEAHQSSKTWHKMLELSWLRMFRHQPLLSVFWGTATSPVEQQVQHLLGGGKGPVSAQEDGDVGGIIALEG